MAAILLPAVCQSVDIRNSVAAFQRLSGCRVVEGFVQIVLIDHATESSFSNLTFPELREITHYLLLYRVNGLRSLGKLFPNLTVIRGDMLFLNYALVVFEMIHLQVTVQYLGYPHALQADAGSASLCLEKMYFNLG